MKTIKRILWILSIIPWLLSFVFIAYCVFLPYLIIYSFNKDYDGYMSDMVDKALDFSTDWCDNIFNLFPNDKIEHVDTIKEQRFKKLKYLNKKWYNIF